MLYLKQRKAPDSIVIEGFRNNPNYCTGLGGQLSTISDQDVIEVIERNQRM